MQIPSRWEREEEFRIVVAEPCVLIKREYSDSHPRGEHSTSGFSTYNKIPNLIVSPAFYFLFCATNNNERSCAKHMNFGSTISFSEVTSIFFYPFFRKLIHVVAVSFLGGYKTEDMNDVKSVLGNLGKTCRLPSQLE